MVGKRAQFEAKGGNDIGWLFFALPPKSWLLFAKFTAVLQRKLRYLSTMSCFICTFISTTTSRKQGKFDALMITASNYNQIKCNFCIRLSIKRLRRGFR